MPLRYYRRFRVAQCERPVTIARARIREQPRPKADKDRSGLFAAQIYIEAHFAGRKSLLY